MNGNRGVTIASLTVYIIAMLLVIAIIATITSFFYTNVSNLDTKSKNILEITKFNMYFIEETKKSKNKVLEVAANKSKIIFSSGNTYTFQDECIYLNSIRICENVKNAQFSVDEKNNIVSVLITIGSNLEYTKTTQYVLNN